MAFCGIVTLSRHCRHPPPPLLLFCTSRVNPPPPQLQFHHWRRRASTISISMSSSSPAKLTAPFGSWKSPITSDVVSGSEKRLGGFATDSFGRLYWLESRPAESGLVFTCFSITSSIALCVILKCCCDFRKC